MSGVMAGTPKADIMFIISYARVIFKIDREVRRRKLDVTINADEFLGMEAPGQLIGSVLNEDLLGDMGYTKSVTFVDDLTIPIYAKASPLYS